MELFNNKTVRTAAYVALGFFATLFFSYAMFPLEAIQGKLQHQIETAIPGLHVSFGDASPWRLSGLEAEDVKVTFDRPSGEPMTATIDRARARVQLIPLLFKRYELSFDVRLGDGRISGDANMGPSAVGLVLQINDLDLAHPPMAGRWLGTDVGGTINSDIDITIDNDPKKTNGHAELDLTKARFGELSIMGFTLPAIDFGTTNVQFDIKDGVMTAKKFDQRSSDLEAKLTGDITLRKQIMASNLNLGLKFKLTDEFLSKNPKFKTILDLSGAKRTKSPDGFMSAKLTGALSNPIPSL